MSTIQEFDYSVNLLQAILWQYNDATNLQSLINQKQAWYTENQTQFWTDWYNNVFNLMTANTFGLAIWSIILDVPLYLINEPEDPNKPIFGFNAYNPSYPTLENTYTNFGSGNFSSFGEVITLTDDEQRFLLRLKYFKLTSRGAIPEINTFLNYLFATSGGEFTGTAWALDGLDMSMTYVFTQPLPAVINQLLVDLDLLPRPTGVMIKAYIVVTDTIFGFNAYDPSYPVLENINQNFSNGNFIPSSFI